MPSRLFVTLGTRVPQSGIFSDLWTRRQRAEPARLRAAVPTSTQHIRARRRYGQLAETPRYDISSAARARRTMAEVQSPAGASKRTPPAPSKRDAVPSERPQSKRRAPAPLPRHGTAARRLFEVLGVHKGPTSKRQSAPAAHRGRACAPRHARRAERVAHANTNRNRETPHAGPRTTSCNS